MRVKFEYHSEPVNLTLVLPLSPPQRMVHGSYGARNGGQDLGRGGNASGAERPPPSHWEG